MHRQIFKYHPQCGYTYVPALKVRVLHEGGGYLFKTNDQGFRTHDLNDSNGRAFRIALFGDSFTAGEGVNDGERFGDLLERKVPDTRVFNFAVPGTGTDQHFLIYREFAKDFPCDLVVVAVLVENIRRVEARYRPVRTRTGEVRLAAKPFFTLSKAGSLDLLGTPVEKKFLREEELPANERGHVDRGGRFSLVRRAITQLTPGLKDHIQRLARYQPLPQYKSSSEISWQVMRKILETWHAEVKVPMVVMPIPIHQYIEETADSESCRRRFQELGDRKGLIVHDQFPSYQRLSSEERRALRFPKDVHPTPLHHELIATSLAGLVARLKGTN